MLGSPASKAVVMVVIKSLFPKEKRSSMTPLSSDKDYGTLKGELKQKEKKLVLVESNKHFSVVFKIQCNIPKPKANGATHTDSTHDRIFA